MRDQDLKNALKVAYGAAVDPFIPQDKNPELEAWKAQNPLTALTAEIGGGLLPYGAWSRVLTKTPFGKELVNKAKGLVKSPIAKGAVEGSLHAVPVDVLRAVTHEVAGDGGGDDLKNAALFGALGGGAGAGIGAFRAAGKAPPELSAVIGKVKEEETPQQWLRSIREYARRTDEPLLSGQLHEAANKVASQIRDEVPSARIGKKKVSGQYLLARVATPDIEKGDKVRRDLNRLFRGGKRLNRGKGGIRNWEEVATRGGLLGDWESLVKYPRLLVDKKGRTTKTIIEGMHKLEDGVFAVREKYGLYVVAKKLPTVLNDKGKVTKKNQWLLFKTDNVSHFAKVSQDFIDVITDKNAWQAATAAVSSETAPTLGAIRRFINDRNVQNAADDEKAFLALVGAKPKYAALGKLKESASQFLTPLPHQLRDNPLARIALSSLQLSFEHAQERSTRILHGKVGLAGKDNLAKEALLGRVHKEIDDGLIEKHLYGLSEEGLRQFNYINKVRPSKELIEEWRAAGEIEEGVYNFAVKYLDVSDRLAMEIVAVDDLRGVVNLVPKLNWFTPRVLGGKFNRRIVDKAGRTIQNISKDNKEELNEIAKEVLSEAKKEGKEWGVTKSYITDSQQEKDLLLLGMTHRSADTEIAEKILAKIEQKRRPKMFEKSDDVPGYKTDFTVEEMADHIKKTINSRLTYIASASWQTEILPFLARLNNLGDTSALKIIEHRYDQFRGIRRKSSIEKAYDNAVAPLFGKDSAMRTISAINKYTLHATFGMGDTAFSTMTALTALQTAIPEAMMVMRSPKYVQKYYDSVLTTDQAGRIYGSAEVMSQVKLQRESFKLLGKPDKEFLSAVSYASRDGTLSPAFAESYIGQVSSELSRAPQLIKEGRIGKALEAVSEIGIAAPERFSRIQAFAAFYLIGKDFMKLSGERLYRMAKQGADRSMYRYSPADRPRIFSGPLGVSLGLFKTWSTMYMFNLAKIGAYSYADKLIAPILAVGAGNLMINGVRGLPFYGAVETLAGLFTDKSLMEHVYETFNGEDTTTSDALYLGLPTLLPDPLSFSLTSRASPPGNEVMRDASMFTSFASLRRAQYLFKAGLNARQFMTVEGFTNPLTDENTLGALYQALAPKTFSRVLTTTVDEAINPSTGYPTHKLETSERILYYLGFSPTKMERRLQVGGELYKNLNERKRTTSAYGERWAELEQENDIAGIQELVKDAISVGLDIDSVAASARTRNDRFDSDSFWRYTEEDVMRRMHSLKGAL